MRRSLEIDGLRHLTGIPAASRLGPFLASSVIPPFTPGTRDVPEDREGQYANIFRHAGAILDAAGADWGSVIKMDFWAPDQAARDALEAFWLSAFPHPESRPARHTHASPGGPPTATLLAIIDSVPHPDRED